MIINSKSRFLPILGISFSIILKTIIDFSVYDPSTHQPKYYCIEFYWLKENFLSSNVLLLNLAHRISIINVGYSTSQRYLTSMEILPSQYSGIFAISYFRYEMFLQNFISKTIFRDMIAIFVGKIKDAQNFIKSFRIYRIFYFVSDFSHFFRRKFIMRGKDSSVQSNDDALSGANGLYGDTLSIYLLPLQLNISLGKV